MDKVINGNVGNDVITGLGGADTLSGAAGADTFVFTAVSDSATGAPDHITDFDPNADFIDLHLIDADTVNGGDQGFTFVGSFSSTAGEATLTYDAGHNQTTFAGDVNGDGVADISIVINGNLNTTHGWVL